MLTFSFKIFNFTNSAPLLKEQLVKNEILNLKNDLRNKDQMIECGSRTKSGENTFKYIYSRLSNKFVVDKLEICASEVDEVVEVVENVEVCASEVDEVVEVVENVEIIELTCLYLSDVESEIFNYAINSIVESIKKIHELCELNGLFHVTKGLRYKILSISANEVISETDSLSQALSNIRLESYPRDEHVAEVINKIPIKRGRGRPRKN
ncbi:unnamed protein product [Brachionus calyciflorus]|uniref:Uncharacterized protein n=1 Tax=Brachionus calyciflorus TaxID=104777 RepID=A0A813VRY1_9BILA|nr:unnamed protein product [Brachionus calyciflorus]